MGSEDAVKALRKIAPDVAYEHRSQGLDVRDEPRFVLLQLSDRGLVALFPELATWLPRVIFG